MKLSLFCTTLCLFYLCASVRSARVRLPRSEAELSIKNLVVEADSDGSQGLSKVEMVEWMMRLEKAETMKGLRNHFREADRDNNGYVTLLEFAHTMAAVVGDIRLDEVLAYSRLIFNGADKDEDGQLSLKEYAAFVHPELHIEMLDVLENAFLEQYDSNDDGLMSFYEFIGVYMPKSADHRGIDPEWADRSKAMFTNLDSSKDGMLDREEMRRWVAAEVTHSAHEEAVRLLSEADQNKDGELSHGEALTQLDLISDSQLLKNAHSQI